MSVTDTIRRIFRIPALVKTMQFPSEGKQRVLFRKLREIDPTLFEHLNPAHRTLFLRQTGDNFRSFRLPTEQMSFTILNQYSLVGSPYGQNVECLWRGPESRNFIIAHCSGLFEELHELATNGIVIGSGEDAEKFNIVVFYVADLSHMQYVLGRVGLTAKYGCFRCKKEQGKWANTPSETAEPLTVREMVKLGEEALAELGPDPKNGTTVYTNFHHRNWGQVQTVLFPSVILETIPPCGLHLILAVHRLLWKCTVSLAKMKNQEERIAIALRKIGCKYLAYQMESYYKSKGKYYDGSDTLRMTGNDCKKFEEGVTLFIAAFTCSDDILGVSRSTVKLAQLQKIAQLFHDIATDLRSTTTTSERVTSFKKRVDQFFGQVQKYFPSEGTAKMHYMHVLRDHVPGLMEFWFTALNWGYGMFSTTAGEHLNKRLKIYEAEHTAQGDDRFARIIRMFRVGLLHYPTSLISETKSSKKCGACGQPGHTRKNKLCPNKVAESGHEFIPESDGEAEA